MPIIIEYLKDPQFLPLLVFLKFWKQRYKLIEFQMGMLFELRVFRSYSIKQCLYFVYLNSCPVIFNLRSFHTLEI